MPTGGQNSNAGKPASIQFMTTPYNPNSDDAKPLAIGKFVVEATLAFELIPDNFLIKLRCFITLSVWLGRLCALIVI